MGIKRLLADAIDRPGGRWLLAWATNRLARGRGYDELSVYFSGGRWYHRAGGLIFPGEAAFRYYPYTYEGLARLESRYLSDAADYWLQFYRPREGDVIVDVGAGMGEDVLAFSRAIGAHGRVFAIEPYPPTFAVLEAFCRCNRLDNATPLQLALMDRAGAVSFSSGRDWVEIATTADASGDSSTRGTTLADVCQQHRIERIDYLKMNIEGAEVAALKGMEDVIDRVKAMCVSCHDFRAERGDGEHFRTRAFVVDFLSRHGFRLSFRDDPRPYVRDQVFAVSA